MSRRSFSKLDPKPGSLKNLLLHRLKDKICLSSKTSYAQLVGLPKQYLLYALKAKNPTPALFHFALYPRAPKCPHYPKIKVEFELQEQTKSGLTLVMFDVFFERRVYRAPGKTFLVDDIPYPQDLVKLLFDALDPKIKKPELTRTMLDFNLTTIEPGLRNLFREKYEEIHAHFTQNQNQPKQTPKIKPFHLLNPKQQKL